MNAVGMKTAHSTSAVAMIGPVTSFIACRVASSGDSAERDVPLDVFHHHDGVIHHDADGQHQPEEGERVDGESERVHHGEGADERDRHRGQRDDRGPPRLQEKDDHQHHQQDRLEQRVDDGVDGLAHEDGRVIDDVVVEALRGNLPSTPPWCRRTLSESSMALEPGLWKIGMATAVLLLSCERSEYSLAPSSIRAMSRR